MAVDESPEALIGVSFPVTLSKLSSTSLVIPANTDFQFFYHFDEFKRPIDEIGHSSQSGLETIGSSAHFCGKSMTFGGDINGDDAYDWLVNVCDEILEIIDASIDEYEIGLNLDKNSVKHGKAKVSFHIPTIKKPQEEYNILVNNANIPFEHVLLERSEDSLYFIHPLVSLVF